VWNVSARGYRLPMPEMTLAGLRDRELITAGLHAAQGCVDSTDNPQFVRGAIAAYRWLLGDAVAPVSGDAATASVAAIRREENLADDVIYNAGGPDVARSFAVGAQNALLWARGRDPFPPVSIG
jgi:hypothetical protein